MNNKKYFQNQEIKALLENNKYIFVFHYNSCETNTFNIIKKNITKKLSSSLSSNFSDKLNYIYKIINKPTIKLVKNNLVKNILKDTKFKNINSLFKGPSLIIASKTPNPLHLVPYLENNNIFFMGAIFNNSLLNYYDIQKLFFYKNLKYKLTYIMFLQTLNNSFKYNISTLKKHLEAEKGKN